MKCHRTHWFGHKNLNEETNTYFDMPSLIAYHVFTISVKMKNSIWNYLSFYYLNPVNFN